MSFTQLSLAALLQSAVNKCRETPSTQLIVAVLMTFIAGRLITDFVLPLFDPVKAPYAGYRSAFEPTFLVRARFSWGSQGMIENGYKKFKNSMYRLRRNDRDILVLPYKYVDELRSLPQKKLSSIQALIDNLVGKYSASDLLLESDLHTRILQHKITPNLANFTAAMKNELDFALTKAVPKSDDWIQVHIYEILLELVTRISARIFVGDGLCRDESWLRVSKAYPEQATLTTMTLRAFPPFLHPFIAFILPSAWKTQAEVRAGKRMLIPYINERRFAEKNIFGYEKPADFLQWMMDAADNKESDAGKLAQRELIMGLASVHTTTMAAAHALYDMCARPEYFHILRNEISELLKEGDGWQKDTVNKMMKMDSFLKESQRISPASLLGFHRIVQKEPITLSDGVVLPPYTHICIASHATSSDPTVIPSQEFDGLRYYRRRLSAPHGEKNLLQYAMTDKEHLHFGHGKFACPGRFFAANELKMILGELLLRWEFKFRDGEGRPENFNADEFLYPNPEARILMRERRV